MVKIKKHTLRILVCLAALLLASPNLWAQKLKVEDVVARHLESIGAKAKRDAVKNRMAIGVSSFESKLPAKTTNGKAVIASDDRNLMFLASFNSQEYPFEKIGYFNDKIELPWVTAGTRSPLGAFLSDHPKILSEGLFAGAVSEFWTLLDLEARKAQVKLSGTKKIDDRKAYVMEYYPRGVGSSEFTIKLFFDTETYRHLRTEYYEQINSSQDRFGQLGRQGGVKIQLIETFDEFKTVDGITLPYSYRADYRTDSNSGVYEFIWGIKIQEYRLNQNLAADFFKFDTKQP